MNGNDSLRTRFCDSICFQNLMKYKTLRLRKEIKRVRTFQKLVGIAYDTLSEKKALENACEEKANSVCNRSIHH